MIDASFFRKRPKVVWSDRIVWAEDGGPIRTILTGRHTKKTGTVIAAKAGYRALPWESDAEQVMMFVAELSPRILYLMAQPHRFEFHDEATGLNFVYFPDLYVCAHPSLVDDVVRRGIPFAVAALSPYSSPVRMEETVGFLLEAKKANDRRSKQELYEYKLEIACEKYAGAGYWFKEVSYENHLCCVDLRALMYVILERRSACELRDIRVVRDLFARSRGMVAADTVSRVLRNDDTAWPIICAMLARRILTCDLTMGLHRDTLLQMVEH